MKFETFNFETLNFEAVNFLILNFETWNFETKILKFRFWDFPNCVGVLTRSTTFSPVPKGSLNEREAICWITAQR